MSNEIFCVKCGNEFFTTVYKFYDLGSPSKGISKIFSSDHAYFKAEVDGKMRLVADVKVFRCEKCGYAPAKGGFKSSDGAG